MIIALNNQKKLFSKLFYPIFLALVLCIFPLLTSFNIHAASEPVHVFDYAGTLNDNQINELEDLSYSYYEQTGHHYIILTTTDYSEYNFSASQSMERNAELYEEAFYNWYKSTYTDSNSCAILTIKLAGENEADISENRYADISGQGIIKANLETDRCFLAFDQIKSDLSDKDYFTAYKKFMKVVNRYQKIKPGISPESITLKIWFQLLIAIIISAIIIFFMIFSSGGTMTANGQTYIDKSKSKLLRNEDHYIRTSTTRTKRSSSSNSSSGGSSGGSSHGGGHF